MTADRHELGRLAAGLAPAVRSLMTQVAERAILPRFRTLNEGECTEKSPGEPVTIADREAEAMLHEGLAALLPEASVVGEEAVAACPALLGKLADPLCWVIDPLDGTGYFAAGQPPFGVMVALAAGGIAVGGWIFEPLSGRFCWAAAGQGCWVNDQRTQVRPSTPPTSFGLSPLLKQRADRYQTVVSRLTGRFTIQDIPRCAAAHYPAMLGGAPALTYFERTLPWDHAAGALLIAEAGGRVARLDGSPYRLDDARTGLLVSTDPSLWSQAAALLQDLPD